MTRRHRQEPVGPQAPPGRHAVRHLPGRRLPLRHPGLGDTLSANFDTLFTNANAGTDAVVRSATKISSDQRQNTRGAIAASLLDHGPKARPGWPTPSPSSTATASSSAPTASVGGNGPPTPSRQLDHRPVAQPVPARRRPRPAGRRRGRHQPGRGQHRPPPPGRHHHRPRPRPLHVRIVGIATFGTADGFGPATFTGLTLHAAEQDLTNNPAQLTRSSSRRRPGVSAERARRPAAAGPPNRRAGDHRRPARRRERLPDQQRVPQLPPHLPAGLRRSSPCSSPPSASTTPSRSSPPSAAARSALLRAIGATRRQVLTATAAETLAVGTRRVRPRVGRRGIGIAGLLKGLFAGVRVRPPRRRARPAAIQRRDRGRRRPGRHRWSPAWRQHSGPSRVTPLAALRDVAVEEVALVDAGVSSPAGRSPPSA